MLTFHDVTKEFRLDEQNTITPVRDVSLEIGQGEFVVVIGRSGTGKTTLLNLAAGLVRPTSGKVTIDDADPSAMSDTEVSALRSKKLGFIFQFPSLVPALTIKDNVGLPAMFARQNGVHRTFERTAALLDTLGLASKMDVYPRQLSAGEQKRVVIARALMNQPQLILADEPTSDLDVRTEQEVMTTLRNINAAGVTFLIVTHSLELVGFATRAFEMQNGQLTAISTSPAAGRYRN